MHKEIQCAILMGTLAIVSVRAILGCLGFQSSFHFLEEAFLDSSQLGASGKVASSMYFCPTAVALDITLAYVTILPTGQ